ncbi:MAG TPA: glycosyl hydrolase family 28 protein [Dongiaceae bacterium]|nr:glycosyl hydrolase family 28 protein [Dongiaceae bacterium]
MPGGPSGECRAKAYGAKGDGVALDSPSINAAVESCHSRGGGTVLLEAGTFRSGTIRLLDNVTLKLEPGAIILGSENLADYTRLAHPSEGRDTALIVAENVKNIAIVGEGRIDGNGRAFTDNGVPHFFPFFETAATRQGEAYTARVREGREGPVRMRERPGNLILLLHSDGITLRDFHVLDSPNWSIHVACSNHVWVNGLDVRNSLLVPNSDAMDISGSSNVIIANSYLEAGDDGLVLGGPCADGWCQQAAANITASNLILHSRSAAIRIGPSAKGIRNLTVQNVVIKDSNRGINIQARAGEVAEDLLFSNIVSETRLIDGPWWGSGEPVSMTVARWAYESWPDVPMQAVGRIRHVVFDNVIANSQSPIVVYSSEPDRIEDIEFRNLHLTMQANPLQAVLGGNLDLEPTTPMKLGVTRHDLSAFEIHGVRDLRIADLQVRWEGAFPEFYRNALHAEYFDGLTVDGFRGQGSAPRFAAISFEHGKNVSLRNAHAISGALMQSGQSQRQEASTQIPPAKP